MLSVLFLAAAYGAWRILQSAVEAVRKLPRSNEDLIFF
jgi:hypothetical protein